MNDCYLQTRWSCSVRRDVPEWKGMFQSLVHAEHRRQSRRAALTARVEYRDADVTTPVFTRKHFHPSTRGSHGPVRS
jgi:hypothetical protein